MRFFLEFVSCCGSATQRPAVQTTSSQPLEEEEKSLVPPSRQRHSKKRGRLGPSAAGPEWRPSLGSISEDNIVPRRERGDDRDGKMGSESNVKRRSGGGSGAAKVHHRNYGDDYKRASVPTIMPPFSPTPFMF